MSTRTPVVEILDPIVVECLKRMTPQERLLQAFRFWETGRAMVWGSVRQQYPEWSDDQVEREAARRLSHGATSHVGR